MVLMAEVVELQLDVVKGEHRVILTIVHRGVGAWMHGRVGAINWTINDTDCLHQWRIPRWIPPLVSWFRAPGSFPSYTFQLPIQFFQSRIEEDF